MAIDNGCMELDCSAHLRNDSADKSMGFDVLITYVDECVVYTDIQASEYASTPDGVLEMLRVGMMGGKLNSKCTDGVTLIYEVGHGAISDAVGESDTLALECFHAPEDNAEVHAEYVARLRSGEKF